MRTLFVGGSQHGQWADLPAQDYVIRVPRPHNPATLRYSDDISLGVLDLAETYWVDKVPIEMQDMRCVVRTAVWAGFPPGTDRTRATISAIFQRDIAEMFDERSWDEWVSTTE